jgi:hypothetical protein
VRHVEDAVVGSSREAMPVIIKVIYQVEGRPIVKYPPVMAYIGVGIVTERIVVNDEAVLLSHAWQLFFDRVIIR